jgi:hypothetical protein
MDAQATDGLLRFFRSMHDPRADNARHPFSDILTLAILAVLCGSDSWEAVEACGMRQRPMAGGFSGAAAWHPLARHV